MARVFQLSLFAAAAVLLPWSVSLIFFHTPIEAELGTVQKIFYFHVPLAWIMMLFALVAGIAALVQLLRQGRSAHALATASAEMVVLAGLGVLLSGPIWAHASWGRAWDWDPRLVSTALLWLVFAAYMLVVHYGGVGADRLAAGLAVFGAIDVPIIYYAVKIWRTTHPSNEVVRTLPPQMWAAMWPALSGLACLCVGLVVLRIRQVRMAQALDDLWIDLDEVNHHGSQPQL